MAQIPFFRGVYAIRNRRTGAMYVGCTQQLDYRWQNHLSALRAGKHDQPQLQDAWNADGGVEGFELVMLEWVRSGGRTELRWALRAAERRWIADLLSKGVALYNKTIPSLGISVVDETAAETATDLTAEVA